MSDTKFPPCPVSECKSKLASPKQLMCQAHWERVSDATKAQLQGLKKDRASTAFIEAVKAAIAEVEADEKKEREVDAYIGRY